MDHHITRRILHGIGANGYGLLVTVVVQLAGVPILLHAWGAQLYGEWLILAAIPTYLSMTDLGFSQSAGNDMTAHVARGKCAEAQAALTPRGPLNAATLAISTMTPHRTSINPCCGPTAAESSTCRVGPAGRSHPPMQACPLLCPRVVLEPR